MPVDTKSWTEAQRTAYIAAQTDLEHEAEALAALEAEEAARKNAPESVIAGMQAEAAQKRAALALAKRELVADGVYAKMCAEHGEGRVGRLITKEGSVILRPMTLAEVDAATMGAKDLKGLDVLKFGREQIKSIAVYPSAEELDKLADRYVGLWSELFGVRDAISQAAREDTAGKG